MDSKANQGMQNNRVDAIDALRGFALAGIVVAHMYEHYISAPRPTDGWPVELGVIDQVVSIFVNIFVYGKFFSIFSVLFGVSFAIMMDRAAAKGQNFAGRFLWRLAILFAIGFLHSLLYRGDILTVYVSVGVLLPFFYGLSNRWLLAIAAVLFAGAGRYIFFAATGSVSLLAEPPMPDSPAVAAYVHTLKYGSMLDVMRENLAHGFLHKIDFQLGMMGRQYLTLGYFLVGVWLFRIGFVHNITRYAGVLKKVLWWSLGLTVLFYMLMGVAFATLPEPLNMASWHFLFALTLYDLGSIAGTAMFISAFLLAYLKWTNGWARSLASYGRTALSSYILQSLIGTFIFYGWGLGLVGELHDWQTLLLSGVVIYLQIRLSVWWLSRYQYGPLEWLWRAATWFQVPKLRRPPVSSL